jgi:hypothetical protein
LGWALRQLVSLRLMVDGVGGYNLQLGVVQQEY